ncbi:hypothetical protein ANRL4_02430 [Anaerolineae bacterium]|nr:hypothetical protein ANRL4_02430 [Anaerolineae bacterium]
MSVHQPDDTDIQGFSYSTLEEELLNERAVLNEARLPDGRIQFTGAIYHGESWVTSPEEHERLLSLLKQQEHIIVTQYRIVK